MAKIINTIENFIDFAHNKHGVGKIEKHCFLIFGNFFMEQISSVESMIGMSSYIIEIG